MKNDVFHIPLREASHETTRQRIQEHRNFAVWYMSIGAETRTAFDLLFLTDVTPELIDFARQVPEAEWWRSVFLRVISSGNPDPSAQTLLTSHALLTVVADIEAYGRRDQARLA